MEMRGMPYGTIDKYTGTNIVDAVLWSFFDPPNQPLRELNQRDNNV
jgi:hypothetical protein